MGNYYLVGQKIDLSYLNLGGLARPKKQKRDSSEINFPKQTTVKIDGDEEVVRQLVDSIKDIKVTYHIDIK